MKKERWYIVTKASDDGTFEVGEHIKLEKDGAIICKEAQGWIDAADVAEAIIGMEYVVDQKWIQLNINFCKAKIIELEKMLAED